MIKAFLFDYGGVMSDGGVRYEIPDRLARNLDIDRSVAYEVLEPLWAPHMAGKLPAPEFWSVVEEQLDRQISPSQRQIWNTWEDMQLRPEMVRMVQGLKRGGFIVGLVSNVMPETAADIRRNGGYSPFDFTVLSCEFGALKPKESIYERAMEHLGTIACREVLFIDDQRACTSTARQLGMGTILAQEPGAIIRAVVASLTISNRLVA